MKLRKILIRIGAGLLLFIGLVLAVRAVLNFTEGRALAKSLEELRAKGVALRAADLAAPCADEDNAARDWKAFEDIVTVNGNQDAALIGRVWTDFVAGRPFVPGDRAALEDLISRNRRAFDLLAEMKNKPCFIYRDPDTTLLESRIPNAVKILRAAKLLQISSVLDAERGDIDRAIDQAETGLKTAPMFATDGNSLISCLIGFADARMWAYYLGEMLRGRPVRDDQLARLMAVLDPGPWQRHLATAIRAERVVFLEAGASLIGGSLADADLIWGKLSFIQRVGIWLGRPLLKRDMRRSLPLYIELEELTESPYFRSRDAFISGTPRTRRRPWYAFLSRAMMPNMDASFLKAAQIEATYLADRTGLACRLFRNRTGRYPASLDELVPGILKEVPIDPFTGKPFVYRREGEGFIVYSLGSNQKDDGGRSTFMITRLVEDKDDDCSWREDR